MIPFLAAGNEVSLRSGYGFAVYTRTNSRDQEYERLRHLSSRQLKLASAYFNSSYLACFMNALASKLNPASIKIELSCGDSNTDCKYQKFMIYPLIDRIFIVLFM